jgi:5-carboxymethyl-2-hydroxymuconate isomerase
MLSRREAKPVPHLIVEYSANLDAKVDIDELLRELHEAAAASGVFPLGGIRTRAARRERYRIADGHPDNAFVHVVARIRHGRPLDVRQRAGTLLFETLCRHLATAYATTPLGISLEVQEIDPDVSYKQNNLHDYVAQRERAPP